MKSDKDWWRILNDTFVQAKSRHVLPRQYHPLRKQHAHQNPDQEPQQPLLVNSLLEQQPRCWCRHYDD